MDKKEKIKKIIAEAVAEHKAEQKTKKQAILESYLKKIIIETVEEELSNEENLDEISFKGIKKGLSAVGDKISNKASSLKDKVKSEISSFGDKLKNTANSFKSGFDSLYQAFDEASKEGDVEAADEKLYELASEMAKVIQKRNQTAKTLKMGVKSPTIYFKGMKLTENKKK